MRTLAVGKTAKPKGGKRQGRTTQGKEPFQLPLAIAKQLKACAEAHTGQPMAASDAVRYLWINVARPASRGTAKEQPDATMLSGDEWLNVVDEAASLGAQTLIICVGQSFTNCPDIWKICGWAQRAHGLDVGIHTSCREFSESDINEIAELDPAHTWFFVPDTKLPALRALRERGITVLAANVGHDEQSPPCDMPESIVFVSSEGVLYTCGLVLDNDRFRLGHVSEKPLEWILKDESLPRTIPKDVPHPEHGCDACPPLMVKRMASSRS